MYMYKFTTPTILLHVHVDECIYQLTTAKQASITLINNVADPQTQT